MKLVRQSLQGGRAEELKLQKMESSVLSREENKMSERQEVLAKQLELEN